MMYSLLKQSSPLQRKMIKRYILLQQLTKIQLMPLSNNTTVNIFDCLGFSRDTNKHAALEADIKKTINGHIKHGYKVKCSCI